MVTIKEVKVKALVMYACGGFISIYDRTNTIL